MNNSRFLRCPVRRHRPKPGNPRQRAQRALEITALPARPQIEDITVRYATLEALEHAELRYRHRRPPPAEPSAAAAAYLRRRWGAALRADPFYSPNLSLSGRPFTLAFPPRTQGPQGGERLACSDPPPASGLARPAAPES